LDFVDWCGRVLTAMAEVRRASTQARSMGTRDLEIAAVIFGQDAVFGPSGFHGSERHGAVNDALSELHQLGMVEESSQSFWRLGQAGEQALADQVALWTRLAQIELTDERRQLLEVVNRLSEHQADDCAWADWVTNDQVLPELGWTGGPGELHAVAKELDERKLAVYSPRGGGNLRLHATYRGLVWGTRRQLTVESRFIDDLVAVWETTSVDFKLEVHTDSPSEKAELIKDILGLANTQVSGRRWLIIGFHPKTHAYVGPPDPKLNQDHIEDLLSAYTRPVPRIDYRVIAYRLGPVAQLEVLRDPRSVPYRVKKALGDKTIREKHIEVDEVFVRHNSHTARADALEIADLDTEREWALAIERGVDPAEPC